MKTSFFKYLLITIAISIVTYGCVKKTSYPTIPEIEYQAFYPYIGDSADLQIKFIDGDGDIGAGQTDSVKNFYYTYYYKDSVDNKYKAYFDNFTNDTLRTSYTIKAPDSGNYNGKPISGEISIRLQQFRHIAQIKQVKYVFYLIDGAGNKSNIVSSPEISVP